MVTVRVEEPAVAVIVTELAFALCQLSATLCPVSIEIGLAERVTVGLGGGGRGLLAVPAQPLRHAKTIDTTPKPRQREGVLLILDVFGSNVDATRHSQMPAWRAMLATIL